MSDHRENIFEALASRTEDLRTELAEDRPEFLDVTVWHATDREPRVEFLLSCGGPTETVTVDCGYETVTYSHSWGMDAVGGDRTEICVYIVPDKETWLEAARMSAEVTA
jgi:hypothetical protein